METGELERGRTNVSDIADMQRLICDYESGINAIMLYLCSNKVVTLKSNIRDVNAIIGKIMEMKTELNDLNKRSPL